MWPSNEMMAAAVAPSLFEFQTPDVDWLHEPQIIQPLKRDPSTKDISISLLQQIGRLCWAADFT